MPGCSLVPVDPVAGPVTALGIPGRVPVYDISIVAWGPTLHETHMTWQISGRSDQELIDALNPHLDLQHARRGIARRLGLSDERQPPLTAMDHVAVDRVALSMMRDPRQTIRTALASIATGYPYKSGRIINNVTLRARDAGVDPPHPRLAIALKSAFSIFDGETLSFKADLPEAVMAVAVGRPIGDLVALDPGLEAISERPIIDIVDRGGRIYVTVRSDWVVLADHLPPIDPQEETP